MHMYRYHTLTGPDTSVYMPGAFGIIMPILHLLFWLAIVVLVLRFLSRRGHFDLNRSHSEASALDIAKTRYAKGELTRAEFENLKKELAE